MSPFTVLLVAHLAGDFLLQTHWMAANKATSHKACAAHIAFYAMPMVAAGLGFGVQLEALALILAQHYLQDRYRLHLHWMRIMSQSTPEQWPVGPLCVDQALHIYWIAIVLSIFA
jgi:hypothetical protein